MYHFNLTVNLEEGGEALHRLPESRLHRLSRRLQPGNEIGH